MRGNCIGLHGEQFVRLPETRARRAVIRANRAARVERIKRGVSRGTYPLEDKLDDLVDQLVRRMSMDMVKTLAERGRGMEGVREQKERRDREVKRSQRALEALAQQLAANPDPFPTLVFSPKTQVKPKGPAPRRPRVPKAPRVPGFCAWGVKLQPSGKRGRPRTACEVCRPSKKLAATA